MHHAGQQAAAHIAPPAPCARCRPCAHAANQATRRGQPKAEPCLVRYRQLRTRSPATARCCCVHCRTRCVQGQQHSNVSYSASAGHSCLGTTSSLRLVHRRCDSPCQTRGPGVGTDSPPGGPPGSALETAPTASYRQKQKGSAGPSPARAAAPPRRPARQATCGQAAVTRARALECPQGRRVAIKQSPPRMLGRLERQAPGAPCAPARAHCYRCPRDTSSSCVEGSRGECRSQPDLLHRVPCLHRRGRTRSIAVMATQSRHGRAPTRAGRQTGRLRCPAVARLDRLAAEAGCPAQCRRAAAGAATVSRMCACHIRPAAAAAGATSSKFDSGASGGPVQRCRHGGGAQEYACAYRLAQGVTRVWRRRRRRQPVACQVRKHGHEHRRPGRAKPPERLEA